MSIKSEFKTFVSEFATTADAARALGVDRSLLSHIQAGRRKITLDLAHRVYKASDKRLCVAAKEFK